MLTSLAKSAPAWSREGSLDERRRRQSSGAGGGVWGEELVVHCAEAGGPPGQAVQRAVRLVSSRLLSTVYCLLSTMMYEWTHTPHPFSFFSVLNSYTHLFTCIFVLF
jgi:hypothetical protein